MKYKVDENTAKRSQVAIGRRKLLATLTAAGAAGLAGCPDVTVNIGDGGGDGGDGGGVFDDSGDDDGSDGSDGSDGASGDLSCTDVTNGYDQQDVGARPVIFDFEYPAIFDELEYIQGPSLVIYEGSQGSGDGEIDIEVTQVTDPEESVGGVSEQGSSGTTTTFNGEEVEFFGISDGTDLAWVGNLPYQLDGERQLLTMRLTLSTFGEGSNECGDALREAAEHILDSMEINSETTL